MKEYTFFIPGPLPGLNEIINLSKRHWAAYYVKKVKLTQDIAMIASIKVPQCRNKIWVDFEWHEEGRLRDMDNIAFAKKFILDGLVEAGRIPDDGWNWISGFSDSFKRVEAGWSGVCVTVKEIDEGGEA